MARSTFPSQTVQNTSAAAHFLKFRCPKIARRCGAKHISKSNCAKHFSGGSLFEVLMSKSCTPLWREAHCQVKIKKHDVFGHFYDARMSKNCRKMARRCGAKYICKSNRTKHWRFASLLEVPMSQRCNMD